MTKQLLANAIITPDGTVLQSKHRHDFQSHKDANGHEYDVDGGLYYCSRGWTPDAPPWEELSLYEGDSHYKIRELFCWGTYGPDGNDPLHWLVLKDMTTEHISNILTHCKLQNHIYKVFEDELTWRKGYEQN